MPWTAVDSAGPADVLPWHSRSGSNSMNTPAQLTSSVPLSTLLGMIWRRRYLALLVGAVVAALVFLATMSIVPLYESEAMLVVDKGRKALQFQPEDVEKGTEFSLLNTQ